jgi:hypothetical protein
MGTAIAWIATALLIALAVYACAGIAFAPPFLVRGIHRLDAAAHGSGIAFRLILVPGVVALWPVLLAAWLRRGR